MTNATCFNHKNLIVYIAQIQFFFTLKYLYRFWRALPKTSHQACIFWFLNRATNEPLKKLSFRIDFFTTSPLLQPQVLPSNLMQKW